MKKVITIIPKALSEVKKLKVPLDLKKALLANQEVKVAWDDITPIAQRDFIAWIEGAKQSTTRARRIRVACDKLKKGDRRPCCYAVVPMNLYKALGANPHAKAVWSTLTPTERRDFVGWVTEGDTSAIRAQRVIKTCELLALMEKNSKSL